MVCLCWSVSLPAKVTRVVLYQMIGKQMTFGVDTSLNVCTQFSIVLDCRTNTLQVKSYVSLSYDLTRLEQSSFNRVFQATNPNFFGQAPILALSRCW
jgi:hypothetical protein